MKNFFLLLLISLLQDLANAGRTVLVVSDLNEDSINQPIVEVYDFLSRTWRLFEAPPQIPTEENSFQAPDRIGKPHAARLINEASLLELDLGVPSLKTAELPEDIDGAASFYYGDTLCLAGGYNTNTSELLNDVVCWNPLASTGSKWVALPKMKQGRHKSAAVVLDGKLYVAGGYDPIRHVFLDSVEVFDDVSQKWYFVNNLLMGGRAGHRIEAVKGKLYVIGGWRKFQFLDEVEEYDPILDRWTLKESMPQALAYFGSAVKNEEIYVIGGISGFRSSQEENGLMVYSPSRDTWAAVQPPMSILKGKVSAVIATDL